MQEKGQHPPNFRGSYPGQPLSAAEVRALLRACSQRAPTGIRNRGLITVMYRAGLRVSEALDLRPSDINPQDGTVRVLDGKGHKPRTVSLDDGGLAVVQRWTDKRRELGLRNGRCTCPEDERSRSCTAHLFCTLAGGPVSDRYVRDMLKRLAGRAGIDKRVHPHGLRHTHAAELVREGVSINVIRDQLGHSSLAVTDRYLRDIAPADVMAMGRGRSWNPDE